MDNQSNRILAEIRDAATAPSDMERLIDQLTKFREALTGRIDRPRRQPEPLADKSLTRRRRRVTK
jgi:hypothetical protein